jgi:hypothetical protein
MNETNTGGTLTAAPAAGMATNISDNNFRKLQELRRSPISSEKDGYLGVMLVNRAGWTTAQAAQFLGLDEAGLQTWISTFAQTSDVGELGNLPAPRIVS